MPHPERCRERTPSQRTHLTINERGEAVTEDQPARGRAIGKRRVRGRAVLCPRSPNLCPRSPCDGVQRRALRDEAVWGGACGRGRRGEQVGEAGGSRGDCFGGDELWRRVAFGEGNHHAAIWGCGARSPPRARSGWRECIAAFKAGPSSVLRCSRESAGHFPSRCFCCSSYQCG